jgi:hypothetical protein
LSGVRGWQTRGTTTSWLSRVSTIQLRRMEDRRDRRKTADALSGIGLPMHVSKNAAMFFLLSSDWFYTCQPLLLGNSLEARLDTPRRTHPASWRWRKTEGSSPPSSGPWPWRLPSTPRSSDPSPLQDPGSTAPHQHTLLRRGGARSTPTAGAQRPRAPRP